MIMVHIRAQHFPKGAYKKPHSRNIGSHKIVKRTCSNAYVLELPQDMALVMYLILRIQHYIKAIMLRNVLNKMLFNCHLTQIFFISNKNSLKEKRKPDSNIKKEIESHMRLWTSTQTRIHQVILWIDDGGLSLVGPS